MRLDYRSRLAFGCSAVRGARTRLVDYCSADNNNNVTVVAPAAPYSWDHAWAMAHAALPSS